MSAMSVSRLAFRVAAAALLTATAAVARAQPLAYTGVNLSGGEFGDVKPGVAAIHDKTFTYPNAGEFDYFAAKGVNIVRIPFHWEVLQPTLRQPLVGAEVDRLAEVVKTATDKGLVVLLDPHNYARYYNQVVGTADVPDEAFADFWGRLAPVFKANPRVWMGLMNEPHDMPTDGWRDAANAAIAAIRKSGAKNLILVPGNGWTSAQGWAANHNDTSLLEIRDPADHFIFEVHTYLDSDSSGTKIDVVSPTIGSERLHAFALWCRLHHRHALLGEFGAANTPQAGVAVDNMLRSMEADRDVWTGFTYWSAGPWWGEYMFSVEPKTGPDGKKTDRPQLAFLQPHLQTRPIVGKPVSPVR